MMRRLSLILLTLFLSLSVGAQQQTDVSRPVSAGNAPVAGGSVSLRIAPPQLVGIGRRAQPGEELPKALLVEILTRQNQRDFLVKNRPDLLPEFNNDVAEVGRRTVMDWSQNFHVCPLYFFIDTMAEKVRRGEWEGVLLDSTMKPVANPALQPGERNIYIAYYGSPIPQPDTVGPAGPLGQYMEHDGDDVTSLIRERLLVVDADFRMLPESKPRTNYVRAIRPDYMNARQYRHYRRALTYNAARWYIDYLPTAYSYDATLRRYFRLN